MLALLSPTFLFSLDFLIRLYLFSQMSKQTLKKYEWLLLSLLVGLLAFIFSAHLLWLEPLFLFSVALLLRPKWTTSQYLFNCLLPFSLIDIYQRMSGVYEIKEIIFDYPAFDLEMYIFIVLGLISFLPFYFFFVKILRIDLQNISEIFTYPQFKRLIIFVNSSMIIYNVMMHAVPVLNKDAQINSLSLQFGNIGLKIDLIFLQLMIFCGAILYFNFKIKEILTQELEESKDQQLSAMLSYSNHVESLYRDIRSFRHDYTNLLISLNEAIKAKDMDGVTSIYHSVLSGSDEHLQGDSYEIAKLSQLTDAAMKSLVSAKLLEAQSKGIGISIEIEEAIGLPKAIEVIDMLKILSIFLDNAIEAAQEAKNPYVALGYFQNDAKKILLIENATKLEKINTKTIYHFGKSSKGKERGIGLATVRDTLIKYPEISLKTTSNHFIFRQELQFVEK